MSVATEIQRLQQAKADIKAAIEEKGVTVGDGTIDTYAELISQITGGDGSGGNVGYKTTEVKITSSVTNTQELFDTVFNGANLQHYCIAYLSQPKNTDYIYNQITFLCIANGVKPCVRYRDGIYTRIDVASNYDAAVTIGDIYTVVDLDEYVEDKDYEQGFEDGKNSVADNARYAKTITFTSLNVFGKANVELNFDNVTALANLFDVRTSANKNTTVEHLTINCSTLPSSISQMLYSIGSSSDDVVLKKVIFNVDTSNCTNLTNAFTGRAGLEVIDGKPLDFSANTQSNLNLFARCVLLTDFRLVANTIKVNFNMANCSLLSTETIQSIIDGLADLTGQTSQTLTVHQTVRNKLTDDQLITISNKNWAISPAEATA